MEREKIIEATQASIQHWRDNEHALRIEDVGVGASHCALCKLFVLDRKGTCDGCPIAAVTESQSCNRTPYTAAYSAFMNWDDVRPWLSDEGPAYFLEAWRAREAFHAAARDEIRFLEHVLSTLAFSPEIHRDLVAKGYEYRCFPATWEDDGDAESGPHLTGGPAYDQYASQEEYVIVSEEGKIVHREQRNLAFERWVEENFGPENCDAN